MSKCSGCKNPAYKNWDGDNPHCAFEKSDSYDSQNWNCALINKIRDICYDGQISKPEGVDYQYCEDQKYACIKIDHITLNEDWIGYALWITWYKNRGGTGAMYILDDQIARYPTKQELQVIAKYYGKESSNERICK